MVGNKSHYRAYTDQSTKFTNRKNIENIFKLQSGSVALQS